MVVVVIEFDDISKTPKEIKDNLYASEVGNSIPRGYVADMGGEQVLRYYSYEEIKKGGWYKEFQALSKAEKKKPDFGSFAHYITKEAKVTKLNREVMSFRYGSSVKSILSQFEQKAKNGDDKAKEAEAVIKVVNDWGQKQFSEIEKMKAKEPTKAYLKMESLYKTFLGMPLVESYPEQIRAYKKDKYFAYLLGIRRQFARLMSSEKKNANSAKYLSGKLESFAEKVEDESLKSEAEIMISELSKI